MTLPMLPVQITAADGSTETRYCVADPRDGFCKSFNTLRESEGVTAEPVKCPPTVVVILDSEGHERSRKTFEDPAVKYMREFNKMFPDGSFRAVLESEVGQQRNTEAAQ